MLLQKEHIQLRALEPADLDWLYAVENSTDLWKVSNTLQPFSKHLLTEYIAQSGQDIFSVKQVRLVITYHQKPVGLVDLYDFDPIHHRAGVGIVILSEYQSKGIAKAAIRLLMEYASKILQLHQLYASVTSDNENSLHLFRKLGFIETGIKKDWIFSEGQYKNEHLLQLLLK